MIMKLQWVKGVTWLLPHWCCQWQDGSPQCRGMITCLICPAVVLTQTKYLRSKPLFFCFLQCSGLLLQNVVLHKPIRGLWDWGKWGCYMCNDHIMLTFFPCGDMSCQRPQRVRRMTSQRGRSAWTTRWPSLSTRQSALRTWSSCRSMEPTHGKSTTSMWPSAAISALCSLHSNC